jgi:hypothetical protein
MSESDLNRIEMIDSNTWSNYWSNWNLIRRVIIDTINTHKLQITYIYPKTITSLNYTTIKSHLSNR